MNTSAHIIVVDDELDICDLVESYLMQAGYRVSAAQDGAGLRRLMSETSIDLVILDIGLPDEDGLSLTRYLREHFNVAVIILTGKGELVDRIIGLEVGADDYISKPFDLRELLARVRSVLRRTQLRTPRKEAFINRPVTFAGWIFNPTSRRLFSPQNEEVSLTTGEFELLSIFVSYPNRVLSRDELLNITHNRHASPFDRSIDVQIGRLRRKIESDPENPMLIKTVRGAGYLFTADIEPA